MVELSISGLNEQSATIEPQSEISRKLAAHVKAQ
jgi:hypothetical protein